MTRVDIEWQQCTDCKETEEEYARYEATYEGLDLYADNEEGCGTVSFKGQIIADSVVSLEGDAKDGTEWLVGVLMTKGLKAWAESRSPRKIDIQHVTGGVGVLIQG